MNNDIWFAQPYGINPEYFILLKQVYQKLFPLSFSSQSSRNFSCPKISLVFTREVSFFSAYCYWPGGPSVLKFYFNIPCNIDHLSKRIVDANFKFEVSSHIGNLGSLS